MKSFILVLVLSCSTAALAASNKDSTVISTTASNDSLYVTHYKNGFSIYNGIDSIEFIPSPRLVPASIAYADRRMIVVILASLCRSTAPSDLLMAAKIFYLNDNGELESYSFRNTDYDAATELCAYFQFDNEWLAIKCAGNVLETVPVNETIATFRKYFFEY
jgi:hypothetical protein